MHACVQICMCTCMYACVSVYMCACMCECEDLYVCMCVCMCECVYVHVCASLSGLSLTLREFSTPALPPNSTTSFLPFPVLALGVCSAWVFRNHSRRLTSSPQPSPRSRSGELEDACIVLGLLRIQSQIGCLSFGDSFGFPTFLDKLSHTHPQTITTSFTREHGGELRPTPSPYIEHLSTCPAQPSSNSPLSPYHHSGPQLWWEPLAS